MKKSIRQLCLVALTGSVLAGCAARETEIHTSTTGAQGSGVRDASDASGGAASAAAAGAAIGSPGR
ncbi:MAG: hypothetical protein ACR2II_04605 [Chthoniobacterales bacterium]